MPLITHNVGTGKFRILSINSAQESNIYLGLLAFPSYFKSWPEQKTGPSPSSTTILVFLSLTFFSTSEKELFKSLIASMDKVFLFLELVKDILATFLSQSNLKVTGFEPVEQNHRAILPCIRIMIKLLNKLHNYQILFNHQIRQMTQINKKIKVTFGQINEKNINMLRKINFNALPVKYSTPFYVRVAMQYAKFSKYCYYNDIIIGAYTTRIEDFKEQKHAYILTFGVLEPYRKYGIGRQMMEDLEKEIRDKSDAVGIYLHMHVLNEVGKKFYEKCGFKVEERLDNYYTDLQEPHCYILRKMIRDSPEAKKQQVATTTA